MSDDLRERMNAALEDLLRRNGWNGERNEQVDRETAEILDTFMAVAEAELGRLRNRIAALEANGAELLARAERAEEERDAARLVSKGRTMEQYDQEAAIERLRKHADELKAMASADWEPDDASQAVRAEMLRNARAIQRALRARESNADAPSSVSTATEASGGAGEAQEG